MKPIVLTMISCGIRIGSWDYLKWKHIIPLKDKNDSIIVAAKIIVFDTKNNKEYFSFITPEAYYSLKEWMDFRVSHGEKITGESWLMRNLWKIRSHRYANFVGSAKHPIKFQSSGIRSMINDSWRIQGIREQLENGKRRHEFKSLHGFRKFFESECQKVMKSLNVSYLMGHDTGITAHYYRPKMDELLDDYVKSVPLLTINDEFRLSKQVQQLQEQDDYQKYVIDKKMKEKDDQINALQDSINFLTDTVNRALLANPQNKIITTTTHESGSGMKIVKGIELKPEINNKVIGKVISKK
jgi:Mannitol dehydrogenase Rossmann domain